MSLKTGRNLLAALLLAGASAANAFPFAIDDFKVVQDGVTIFHDGFDGATTPPAAPNFSDGTAGVYWPRGIFSAPAGGKLSLTTAGTEISPVTPNYLVQRGLLEHTVSADGSINASAGLTPGHSFEVSAIYDLNMPQVVSESYGIELGDWAQKNCPDCVRMAVLMNDKGKVNIKFYKINPATQLKTDISSVTADATHPQILLKLKKSDAASNTVTASYTYIDNGVPGTEVPMAGSTTIFNVQQYSLASFLAYTPVATATAQGSNSNLSLTAQVNGAGNYSGKTVNVYVAAIYGGLVFFNNGMSWAQWTGGTMPPYASGVKAGDRTLSILSNLDVSSLSGTTIFVGYGVDQDDMINNTAYSSVYTIQ
ncbi:MAG: hypothetical protein K8F27_09100 [Sulfuricellaceae bacterium]|nr:hypothetical protein [Sulfuricellaceae bacterium]